MLTWPHAYGDWGDVLPRAEACFVQIATAIAARQAVIISVFDAAHEAQVRQQLAAANHANIHLYVNASNDVWARDHGPITVLRDGVPTLLDFTFNGWGGKYRADLDNTLTTRLHAQGAFGARALQTVPVILEGGAIEVNGAGALLTTARCVLSATRNPHLSREQTIALLCEQLGVHTVHMLQHGGLEGDDTDGHIDTIVRFIDENTLVYQACDEPRYSYYTELKAMEAELQALPYRLIALPWPDAVYDADGRRLSAGYANFLIINGAVLLPVFGVAQDAQAVRVMQTAMPGYDILPIDCCALIEQNGGLHCVTMQIPD